MFDKITFTTQNKHDGVNPIDLGRLAECMLFYQSTYIVAGQGMLNQLIRFFGVENLLELIDLGALKIIYTESILGVHTRTENGNQFHDVVEISSPNHLYHDVLRKQCIASVNKSGKGRRLANKIQDKIVVTNHDHIILEGARHSILDQQYISQAAKSVLSSKLNNTANISQLEFFTEKTDRGIVVSTNANFLALNQIYHKIVPPEHSSITPASLLTDVIELEKELYFASSNVSEIASSHISSELAAIKFDYIFKQSQQTEEKVVGFNSIVFDNARDLRDAVNTGKVSSDDLVQVIRKAAKFKGWLQELESSSDLLKEYYEAVTKKSKLDKLPGKSARFTLFTALGLSADAAFTGGLGTIAGVSLGVLDTFYLDKIVAGWKPNQFIEKDVLPLVRKNT
ncbi:MAG: hypothetical protein ACU826_05365 [Gammaproteobacteria bacterium]